MLVRKNDLRRRARATRDAIGRTHLLPVPDAYRSRLAPGLVVAAYHPVGSEADPAPLAAAARAAGCVVALPHVVDRATALRFLVSEADAVLDVGPFGLSQPAADAAEVTPDIILTPLLTFDRRGNRLGQGAGHYDRAFAVYRQAWRVGVAWAAQEIEALEPEPWDVPLHAIATEREWIVVA